MTFSQFHKAGTVPPKKRLKHDLIHSPFDVGDWKIFSDSSHSKESIQSVLNGIFRNLNNKYCKGSDH